MASAGFEPIIPASEQTQTNALDPAATGIGMLVAYSSETLVPTHQFSRGHNPEYHGKNTDVKKELNIIIEISLFNLC
jgi:hypothetical protein